MLLNVCLCNDTVAANIRMARSDAREAGLRTSVDTAHSKGREAAPGDTGGRLEGGELQRVSIRLLPKDAPIMIHDAPVEIFASESEPSAQRGIDAVRRR
ncbi:hypothetical protein LZ190_19280 [Rhodovulum sulfidophilum]|nr:hypothetical protein [Rhodovulum sulfidophilum]